MGRLGWGLAVALFAVLLAAPAAPAAPPAERVIVQWAAGASPAERRELRERAGVEFSADLGGRRFQLVETEPGQTPGDAVRELRADPDVVLAERDGYASADAVPDDPLFGQLWGLRNSGVGVYGFKGAVAGADIGAESAWERTLGTPSTLVAVLDSGYRFEHPDLAAAAWVNPGEIPANGLDDDGNGIVDDARGADFVGADAAAPTVDGDPTDDNLDTGGHGLHVAGTLGASADNGVGIAGVAPGVTIMPLRVCSRLERSLECVFSSAIAANPWTLFVVSAGNEKSNNDAGARRPCTVELDNVICVAATDQADQLASFSNWGANSVDLGAPGTETLSADTRRTLVEDDFEIDDFASKWSASGADGGFGRAAEERLTSFGITDSPGALPVAGSVRASTSAPATLPPGVENCILEFRRSMVAGQGSFRFEVILDGEVAVGVESGSNVPDLRWEGVVLGDALVEGGEVQLRFEYTASADPQPGDGVWLDDVRLHCPARVGEADGYSFRQGTSMAAPHVAGAAALILSLKPSATVAELRQALLGSVDPLPALAGKTTSGGRLDAAAALDLFDAIAPPAPTLTATTPASPSTNRQPRLRGTAQRGADVAVYANATCSGDPVASGSAAQLAGAGVVAALAAGSTTELTVRATDLAPLSSPCSEPLSYTHLKPPEPEGGGDPPPVPDPGGPSPDPGPATPPALPPVSPPLPSPACTVPKLAGKTLAQAKAALRRKACRIGAVRRPARPKGKPRQLVIRSSTPAAGASAADRVVLRLKWRTRPASFRE